MISLLKEITGFVYPERVSISECRAVWRCEKVTDYLREGKQMTKTKLFFFLLVGLSLMLSLPALADFQSGRDAYDRGDYGTALKEWEPLAKQGHALAQFQLGVLYSQGLGVPQNYAEAAKWVRLSAQQGETEAQFNLGRMYFEGLGVAQDWVLALMWTHLAAAQGHEAAIQVQEVLKERLRDDQIAEAQRLAREWKPKEN